MAPCTLLTLGLAVFSQAMTARALDVERAGENSTAASATKKSGSCGCLNWAEIYYNNKAFCGRGNELYFFTKHGFPGAYAAIEPITGVLHKVCYDLFMNLLAPVCVNYDMYPFPPKEKSNMQWCYVPNDCNELNGGGYATNKMGFAQASWHNLQSGSFQAWKFCDPTDATESLVAKPVEEVKTLGKESDVPLSRLMRAAYPVVNITWGKAHYWYEALNRNYQVGRTVSQMIDLIPTASAAEWGTEIVKVHERLAELAKSGQPTILDSTDHGDNFHIIAGRAAYSVMRAVNGDAVYLSGHFGQEFDVICLFGCASSRESAADAVDMETM